MKHKKPERPLTSAAEASVILAISENSSVTHAAASNDYRGIPARATVSSLCIPMYDSYAFAIAGIGTSSQPQGVNASKSYNNTFTTSPNALCGEDLKLPIIVLVRFLYCYDYRPHNFSESVPHIPSYRYQSFLLFGSHEHLQRHHCFLDPFSCQKAPGLSESLYRDDHLYVF